MKSVLSWLAVVAIIGGAGAYGANHFHTLDREKAYKLELAALKDTFKTQSVGLQQLSPEEYSKEIGIHLTRYFQAIGKLSKTYPEFYDLERERKHNAAMIEKGHMTQSQQGAREERIALSLDLMDKMKSGQYRPLYTSADKGFRFDIWDIKPVKSGVETFLQFSYAHWGAFGPVNYDMIIGNIRAEQEEGKPVEVPQIVGEGQPPYLQVKPDRWVQEFPPGVEVGYYTLPTFPQQALGLTLSFQFGIRTVGGSTLYADIKFPEMEIPDAWKIGSDQKWNGRERFASDEELEELGAKPQIVVK